MPHPLGVEPHLRDIENAAKALHCIQKSIYQEGDEYAAGAVYLLSDTILDNCEAIEKLLWPGSGEDDGAQQ